MDSKKIVVVDFCGTLVKDSKSIEKFIILLIKDNPILLIRFYIIKFINIYIVIIRKVLGLDFSLLSFYILTKGFSKEHISKISKDYAKTLILTSRVDIIEEVKKLSKNHDSIIISGAFYDYIDYFMTLLNVKFKAIYSSRIIYDTNNISMGKVDIVYTGKKKLLPLINYSHCSFISFGDSRYDLDLFNASSEVHLVYPKKRFKDSVTSKGWIIHD